MGLAIAPVAVANSSFHWGSINVDINVLPNGDMWVTETQNYVFNAATANQRYRYIPLNKVDSIEFDTVQRGSQNLPKTVRQDSNNLRIEWIQPVNPSESQTFVLTYRVIGGLHVDPQTTKVYWKAIFPDRDAPVNAAKVTVHLPEALANQISDFRFFGVPAIAHQVDAQTVEFIARLTIRPVQELEVQVSFPTDILQVPRPRWQTVTGSLSRAFYRRLPWSFILPAVALWQGTAIMLRRRCPQCHHFSLKPTATVLKEATYTTSGSKRISIHCDRCNYNNTEIRTIVP
ncbi:MAG: hypothetical protein DCF21_20810, partial [Leptolyngbya sp.]